MRQRIMLGLDCNLTTKWQYGTCNASHTSIMFEAWRQMSDDNGSDPITDPCNKARTFAARMYLMADEVLFFWGLLLLDLCCSSPGADNIAHSAMTKHLHMSSQSQCHPARQSWLPATPLICEQPFARYTCNAIHKCQHCYLALQRHWLRMLHDEKACLHVQWLAHSCYNLHTFAQT